jgi:hypothetical protein
VLYIVLFFVVLFYFYYYCYNFFLFGGGGSLWGCLCCNCVHVIRIDKSDIWPKVKVEYPWISDNVICWIKKARLNMMEAEYIHKHWNTCKIKTQNYTLDISAVIPVLYSSCWDLASIFVMKNINKSAVPLLYYYIVFHGLWLVYIYPIFIFFSNKCNKTMPCIHCMYKEQLLVAVSISLLFM